MGPILLLLLHIGVLHGIYITIIMPVMMNICHYQQSSVFFQCYFGSSCPSSSNLESLSSNAGQRRRPRYEKETALDLHIAMFIFDITSCVQFTLNSYIQGYYN